MPLTRFGGPRHARGNDAIDLSFRAADLSDWTTYPANVQQALNYLAANVGGGSGDVTAAANLTNNTLIRGDGGAKGIQDSGITVSDTDAVVIPNSAAPLTIGDNTSAADVVLTFDANDGSGTVTWDGTNERFTILGDIMCAPSVGNPQIYLGDTSNYITKAAGTLWTIAGSNASNLTFLFSNAGAGDAIVQVNQLTSPLLIGGTGSAGDLTLKSTTHATKGLIYFGSGGDVVFDETNTAFGIGCDDPTFITANDRLTVVSLDTNASITAISHRTAAGGSGSFSMGKSRGEDHDNPTTVADGDTIGIFNFKPYDGTSWLNHGRIQCVVNGVVGINQVPLDIQFKTGSAGTGTIVCTITSGLDLEIASGSTIEFAAGTILSNLGLYWNAGGTIDATAGDLTLDCQSSGHHYLQVNGTTEVTVQANIMTFAAGGTDPRIYWGLTNKAQLQSGSNDRFSWGTTGLGFFGNLIAQPAAYTQTYATADRTLSAYTPDDESGAYTGIDNAQAGTVYAQVSDLNALRVAYENLRALCEDATQLANSMLDDLQAYGLFQ